MAELIAQLHERFRFKAPDGFGWGKIKRGSTSDVQQVRLENLTDKPISGVLKVAWNVVEEFDWRGKPICTGWRDSGVEPAENGWMEVNIPSVSDNWYPMGPHAACVIPTIPPRESLMLRFRIVAGSSPSPSATPCRPTLAVEDVRIAFESSDEGVIPL